jgi:hypothetical protein
LIGNLLVIPLLFFLPLTILLFSLASLKSKWYEILKWFGRLSLILIPLLYMTLLGVSERGIGKKLAEWGKVIFE